MSKIITLLAVSVLLTGCAGMGNGKAKLSRNADQDVSRHATSHINNVARDAAATASAATSAANQLP